MVPHNGCIAGVLSTLVFAMAFIAPGCKGIERAESKDRVTAMSATVAEKEAGGALLRTGAFQLGRGVSRDLLHSQGDGLQGFPIP